VEDDDPHRASLVLMASRPLGKVIDDSMVEHGSSLHALIGAIDLADPATGRHGRATTRLGIRLAAAVDPALATSESFRLGCLLHDAGKLAIPADILTKPGRLSEAEWALMRRHPQLGARMCELAGAPRETTAIVRHHHERWDGLGYPNALVGESIPLGARVLAVCDALDAMTSQRAYRDRPLSDREAMERVYASRGSQFDPAIVDTLLRTTWRPRTFVRIGGVEDDVPSAIAC
jgi:HD-GYP domain-containing protein (c-di-GMP phosphodiesterase class II)